MVHRYSLDEVKEQSLLTFDPWKTVFVVGAGVSMARPTGLPGGRELTDFCLEMAVGSEAAGKVQKIWRAASDLVKEDCGAVYPFMRLEIILDYVNKVERLLDGPRFLEGFMGFSKRPGNRNHRLLYGCAQAGSLVLTTNFDTCIENSKGMGVRFENRNGCSYVVADGGAGVYHLHGVAVQTEALSYTLGATLENVKEGVDPLMGAYLLERFKQSWDVIFVGYSGSDFFDLMPYFADLKLDSESKAVFCLHGRPDEREVEKAENYIKGFQHPYIVYGDTTRFLELVSGGAGMEWGKDAGDGCREWRDWREAFQRIVNLRKDRQAVIRGQHLIRLTNQIGIRLDLVDDDWAETLRVVIDFFQSRDLDVLFGSLPDLSATVIGDLEHTVEMMSSIYPGEMMEIQAEFHRQYDEIARARKNIVSPASVARTMTVERLLRIVEKGEVSPRNFNSATVYAMNRLVKESIRRWAENKNDEENNGRLGRLEHGIRIMLSMPYYKYMYLSYYLSLLKLEQIVSAIRHPEEIQLEKEKRMLEIALEISNIGQLVKVYLNLFRKYRLLYGITGKKSYFVQSEKYYEISEAIAGITGMRVDSRDVVMEIG